MNELPIYWTEPTQAEFNVRIQKHRREGDSYLLVLSEPVARAAGGGQAGDRGKLIVGEAELRFTETVIDDNEIAVLTSAPVEKGTKARLVLDIDWRRSMMRNHTGEHLLARALIDLNKDIELGRIWIDGNRGTVEFSGRKISHLDLLAAEKRVQNAVADELEVKTQIINPEDIDESVRAREGVISKHDVLRIVEIDGFDRSACSGIHVKNTGDIKVFKIVDYRVDDKTIHIEFQTGPLALALLSSTYNCVLERRHDHPFEIEQLGAILDKCKSLRQDYDELVGALVRCLSKGIEYLEVGQSRLRAEYLPGLDMRALREISNRVEMPESSLLLLFTAVEQGGKKKCNLIVRTRDMPNDAKCYIADSVTKLGGSGGGSREVYTGGFTHQEEPEVLFQSLVEMLKNTL